MEILFKIVLFIHAIAGGIALFTGSINMLRKKGTGLHVKVGLIYFYAVLTNAISAFFLAIYHPNLFLFSLGVFSFYLAYTGRRYLLKSKITDTVTSQPIDWLLNSGLLCFGLVLTVYCFYKFLIGQFNFIPLAFGVSAMFLSISVIIKMRKSPVKKTSIEFLKSHIGSMVGSYITIFSAFLVVNNHDYFPVLLGWFGPTLVFVPFITMWKKKYVPLITNTK